jgi:hypothetical protein
MVVKIDSSSAVPPQHTESTFKEAFEYDGDQRIILEKVLRAVGLLLEWSGNIGNRPVDGLAAQGLAVLLDQAAEETAQLYSLDEAIAAGADSRTLFDNKKAVSA